MNFIVLNDDGHDFAACMLRERTVFINFASGNGIPFQYAKLIKIIKFIMGLEIEHKYLVKNDGFLPLAVSSYSISQGYLCREPDRTVRVRIKGGKGFLTVKGKNSGAVRAEFEYEIPLEDAEKILKMCLHPVIQKTRYIVPFAGHVWEVDRFNGDLEGLVTAEVELKSTDEEYAVPDFVGEDVTGNPAYYNSNLHNWHKHTIE